MGYFYLHIKLSVLNPNEGVGLSAGCKQGPESVQLHHHQPSVQLPCCSLRDGQGSRPAPQPHRGRGPCQEGTGTPGLLPHH